MAVFRKRKKISIQEEIQNQSASAQSTLLPATPAETQKAQSRKDQKALPEKPRENPGKDREGKTRASWPVQTRLSKMDALGKGQANDSATYSNPSCSTEKWRGSHNEAVEGQTRLL